MPPRTRRAASPKIVIERDEDSEESSEDEEFEDEDNGVNDSEDDEVEEEKEEIDVKKIKGTKPITISLKKVCKVCKKPGHLAGFQGATYVDCPMKPCFLCKLPGHTTMTCPHRVATEHGVVPAPHKSTRHSVNYIFERQLRPHVPAIKPGFLIPDQVTRAVIRYHSRRVTCLEFHPTNNNILLSGDKKGQLGVWDYDKVYEKRVYSNIHSCLLNTMRFSSANDGTIFGASSDGTISCTDLETGISESLMDLNPNGWNGPSSWRMLYGLDINSEKGLVLVADNFGFLYMLDTRTKAKVGEGVLIHKKGSKVVGLHCNPVQPDLLLSCGNNHFARLWDSRRLEAGSSLVSLAHRRVVNSAYFSPHTGSKILTTAQDNRIRVWDSMFVNMESPSREIVHSHDFNRHLTAFRAEWDPKDSSESLAVIGCYISENYNGVALHPIDFIDVSTGQLVAEVIDPNITTISPANKLHPRDDVLASGSSRSLFIWRPKDKSEDMQHKDEKKTMVFCGKADKKQKRKHGGESDDSDDELFKSKGKMSKSKPSPSKVKRFSSANDGTIFGASSDGTISCTDLETGISESLMDLNPNGWNGPSSWRMLYGLDINSEKGLVLVADNFGFLYMLDTRTKAKVGEGVLIHKKGSKVVGLHCNPVQPDLLLSCGNNHFARLWDSRRLEAGSSLVSLAHRRVVNSAYFSPHTGSKILTTAQDNRIRVWDSMFVNMESPSREIVHSHDFNRHLTAFRAEWDPKDSSESLAVIGCYISENYNGVALHPIDFIDVSTGQLVAEVIDPNITTISPANKLHPRDDVLASGSSRSLFIWRPKDKSEDMQHKDEKKTMVFCGKADKKQKRKHGGESDDSDDELFKSKGKMSKSKPSPSKVKR